MASGLKSSARRHAATAVNLALALENFDRPAWLHRSRGAVPRRSSLFRSPKPVTESDLALCDRLIHAYHRAQTEAPSPTGMWSHSVFRTRQQALTHVLDRRDPAALAKLLASMFRSDFVLGMAPGSLVTESRRSPMARLSWLTTLNKLLALAEAVGVTRVENPEQGGTGRAFTEGVEPLVANLEAELRVSLDFPEVGSAYGIVAGGRLITPESPDQVYSARRLHDAITTHLAVLKRPPRIVEIGGGYGAMAYWLLQMLDARYVIVDLPIVNVLQGYFLSQALGAGAVAFFGEPPAQVVILPDHALASIETPFEVLANKDSLPEIPERAALDYLQWARQGCTGLFYSYNQEAAAPFGGVPQIVVAEAVSREGGFERIRRDASWLRRGYVEEIYVPLAADKRRVSSVV